MMNSLYIEFVKMQATGNDFILIDNRDGRLDETGLSDLAPEICDRKFGVGSDGIIALGEEAGGGLVMLYKNPDGSDAGMCGNGARCFTIFAGSLGYGDTIEFRVHENRYHAETTRDGVKIQFPLETEAEHLTIDDRKMLRIYTNTEHVVCLVEADTLEKEDLLVREGRRLRHHTFFAPMGTNANFISGTGTDSLNLQTYERGVEDLTLACGTGAIASALAWHSLQSAGPGSFTYSVQTRGGELTVRFTRSENPAQYGDVSLEGPVEWVFEGRYFKDRPVMAARS